MYVGDIGNYALRKITQQGVVTTLYQRCNKYLNQCSGIGPVTSVAVDSSGNVFFNQQILSGGQISTLVTLYSRSNLGYLSFMPNGTLVVADKGGDTVWLVSQAY